MSTIKVENLTGLSSGANANKIIVPSGQTLDASNGFTAPQLEDNLTYTVSECNFVIFPSFLSSL